ncbi:MAG: 5-deoxy-glucuronate isomerase [Rhodothermales bacterium]
MQYDADNLIIRGTADPNADVFVEVTPERAGWELIRFQSRRLTAGASWNDATGGDELALVVLGGTIDVDSSRGSWTGVGRRKNVFDGLPYALYLPRKTDFTITAASDAEYAVARVPTGEDHSPQLVTPADVPVEIRGGDNATRQINGIIPPGFDCHRLVIVEVYTPSGGWSSYPPHKHDIHKTDDDGNVIEADLEEIYYYRIDREGGFAYQRVYTDPESPLHAAGKGFDEVVMAKDQDVVLVPEGYHPVVSPPGYTTYYLNVLAGSAQSLANTDDPAHAWVKDTYTTRNPAIPIYDVPESSLTTY